METTGFRSLPFTPREVRATEAVLDRIYRASFQGLKGDSLALAAGMLPVEFNRLIQSDPFAEMAALKGRADAEMAHSTVLTNASLAGDAKAALEVLKHQHGWKATQDLNVNVTQQISVLTALEEAKGRVIEHEIAQRVLESDTGARVAQESMPIPTFNTQTA